MQKNALRDRYDIKNEMIGQAEETLPDTVKDCLVRIVKRSAIADLSVLYYTPE